MPILRRAALVVLLAFPLAAAAELKTADVPAGDIHEECMTMGQGDALSYAFSANVPLEFNIHYHEGEAVYFPVQEPASAIRRGVFVAEIAQHYCMMWTNPGAQAAALEVKFDLKGGP